MTSISEAVVDVGGVFSHTQISDSVKQNGNISGHSLALVLIGQMGTLGWNCYILKRLLS